MQVSRGYDLLFQPTRIGLLTAKNRFIAVPHSAGTLEDRVFVDGPRAVVLD